MRWLYATHKKLINETRLLVKPENKELLKHANERHHHCILPPSRTLLEPPVAASEQTIASFAS
jgi:hypothetical protein